LQHNIWLISLQGEDRVAVHCFGTAAIVVQVTGTNWPKPAYTLLVTGLCRFKIDDVLQETPYLIAKVTQLDKLSREEIGKNRTLHHIVCKKFSPVQSSLT